jgi:hypothetical protein
MNMRVAEASRENQNLAKQIMTIKSELMAGRVENQARNLSSKERQPLPAQAESFNRQLKQAAYDSFEHLLKKEGDISAAQMILRHKDVFGVTLEEVKPVVLDYVTDALEGRLTSTKAQKRNPGDFGRAAKAWIAFSMKEGLHKEDAALVKKAASDAIAFAEAETERGQKGYAFITGELRKAFQIPKE